MQESFSAYLTYMRKSKTINKIILYMPFVGLAIIIMGAAVYSTANRNLQNDLPFNAAVVSSKCVIISSEQHCVYRILVLYGKSLIPCDYTMNGPVLANNSTIFVNTPRNGLCEKYECWQCDITPGLMLLVIGACIAAIGVIVLVGRYVIWKCFVCCKVYKGEYEAFQRWRESQAQNGYGQLDQSNYRPVEEGGTPMSRV